MGVNLCFIARVADGMLLVASTDPMRSSDSQETMDVYKSQAKQILAGLTERSPSKCSIDSGPFAFHYVISDAVVYLAMTPKSYPKRAIFRYLGEVAQEFVQEVAATCNGDMRHAPSGEKNACPSSSSQWVGRSAGSRWRSHAIISAAAS